MTIDEKYILSHCSNPVTIDWKNPLTKQYEKREVPCGKCYHCRMTRVNEWYTRMYLNSCYRPFTYFLTLTYDVEKMTQKELDETFAVFTNVNYKSERMLTPLCLCKRHVQLFLKRLRKRFPNVNLQYYCVGEYGRKYGRPHYHLILWTEHELDSETIADVWKLGNIDLHDVTKDARESNTKAFGYVCKYLFKDFDYNKLPTLIYHKKQYEDYDTSLLYTQNIIQGKYIHFPAIAPVFDCETYFKKFGNFMLCSKGYAIGADYLRDHLDEFRKGDLRLFGLHDGDYIFPTYFTRKAQQSCCPYCPFSPKTKDKITASNIDEICTNVMDYASDKHSSKDIFQVFAQTDKLHDPIRDKERLSLQIGADTDFYDYSTRTYYIKSFWNVPTDIDPLMDNPEYSLLRCYDKFRYSRKTNTYDYVGSESLTTVVAKVRKAYSLLRKYFIEPHTKAYYNMLAEKHDYIHKIHHDDVTSFKQTMQFYKELHDNKVRHRQNMYYLTKITF